MATFDQDMNSSSASEEKARITVDLPLSIVATLKDLAKSRGTTMTDALKQAIHTEKFFSDKIASREEKVILEDRKGNQKELVFLNRK